MIDNERPWVGVDTVYTKKLEPGPIIQEAFVRIKNTGKTHKSGKAWIAYAPRPAGRGSATGRDLSFAPGWVEQAQMTN